MSNGKYFGRATVGGKRISLGRYKDIEIVKKISKEIEVLVRNRCDNFRKIYVNSKQV